MSPPRSRPAELADHGVEVLTSQVKQTKTRRSIRAVPLQSAALEALDELLASDEVAPRPQVLAENRWERRERRDSNPRPPA